MSADKLGARSRIDAIASLAEEIDDNTLDEIQAGLNTIADPPFVPASVAIRAGGGVACTVDAECHNPRPI